MNHTYNTGNMATCGICHRSWDYIKDPCPSALCHWCNGRGYSLNPLTKNGRPKRAQKPAPESESNYG